MSFLWRCLEIISVLFRYGVFYRGTRPQKLRIILEKLSGAFVKIGQIMSMRFDLLPPEYCSELLGLLDQIKPLRIEDVNKAFVGEFKDLPDKIFVFFDYKPLASASFGQVHKAVLLGAEQVIVKIQRPNIEKILRVDIIILKLVARLGDAVGLLKALSLSKIAKEFERWSVEEVNYEIEARNTEDFRSHIKNYYTMAAPKIFARYTTKKIITQEFLDGVALSSIINNPEKIAKIDGSRVAFLLFYNAMIQYYIEGIFHADPHPANILVISNDKIGYVDLGITGHVRENRFIMADFAKAVIQKDYNAAVQSFFNLSTLKIKLPKKILNELPELAVILPEIKQILAESLAREFKKYMDEWYNAIEDFKAPIYTKSAALAFLKLVRAASRHRIRLPNDIVLFVRTLIIIDMIALKLDGSFNLVSALDNFFNDYEERIKELRGKELLSLGNECETNDELKLDSEKIEKYLEWILTFAANHRRIYELLPNKLKRLV